MGSILVLTGPFAIVIGSWRVSINARSAMGSLGHEGEPTRGAPQATR